jgi:hypothetical protein
MEQGLRLMICPSEKKVEEDLAFDKTVIEIYKEEYAKLKQKNETLENSVTNKEKKLKIKQRHAVKNTKDEKN